MLRYRIQVSSDSVSLGVCYWYISGLITAGEFDPSESCIKIADVPKDTNLVILVPHTDASRFPAMVCQESFLCGLPLINTPKKINVKVTYNTVLQPTVTRSLRNSIVVNVSLPIAVNVEDFFRGERYISSSMGPDPLYLSNLFHRLFSKFTISAATRQYVRISSADLQGPSHGLKGVNIAKYQSSHVTMVSQVFERCPRQYRPFGRQLPRNDLSIICSLSNLSMGQVRDNFFFCFQLSAIQF